MPPKVETSPTRAIALKAVQEGCGDLSILVHFMEPRDLRPGDNGIVGNCWPPSLRKYIPPRHPKLGYALFPVSAQLGP